MDFVLQNPRTTNGRPYSVHNNDDALFSGQICVYLRREFQTLRPSQDLQREEVLVGGQGWIIFPLGEMGTGGGVGTAGLDPRMDTVAAVDGGTALFV